MHLTLGSRKQTFAHVKLMPFLCLVLSARCDGVDCSFANDDGQLQDHNNAKLAVLARQLIDALHHIITRVPNADHMTDTSGIADPRTSKAKCTATLSEAPSCWRMWG